jgi:hypothetical protein
MYARVPIPVLCSLHFEEIAKDSAFEGEPNNKWSGSRSITLREHYPAQLCGNGGENADELIAPFVKDRGYDWEISIDETLDLWSLQEIPPLNLQLRRDG